ncbi:2866_t:CDS:2, partial [Acaulospora colombiana]
RSTLLSPICTWALEAGCQGVVLSNHGGRQLEYARSGIEVLAEVVDKFKEKGLWPNPNFQIFVDGGVRRATDVLKAVALGATAGRPFLYAMSSYGEAGVDRALEILHEELEMNMRLLGATTIADVVPEMVDARSLCSHSAPPYDELYMANSLLPSLAMSGQGKPIVLPQTPSRTPVTRTRSQRSRLKLHSPLKHNRPVLQPSNSNKTPSTVPTSSFTFAVDHKAHTLMPPRAASTASQGAAKKKTTKTTRSNVAKGK